MRRRGDVLEPTAEMFLEDLRSVPDGKEIFVTIVLARNPKQLRWLWAMLNEIVKAGQWDGDAESLLNWIKIGTGHVNTIIEKATGKVFYVLRSIAVQSMDQLRFQRFLKRVEWFLADRMGIDVGALRQQTTAVAGTADPEPEEKRTLIDDPLDQRLARIAHVLRRAETLEECDKLWTEEKRTAEAKALWQRAPEAVKRIVDMAKLRAVGKASDDEFDRMVNTAINQACEEKAV